jgi:hypothetical protein
MTGPSRLQLRQHQVERINVAPTTCRAGTAASISPFARNQICVALEAYANQKVDRSIVGRMLRVVSIASL